ncbi:MAG TPA: PoNe immunity protein domain-containing protein [Alphaproteobacteria bacterium]
MTKREPLMSNDYFDGKIEYLEKSVRDRLRKLQDQPAIYTKPEVFLYANFRNSYQLIFLDYSRGGDIDGLKSKFGPIVSAWERYLACPNSEVNDFSVIDHYVVSLWLLSFALLFGIEAPLLDRLLECIGNEGKDPLFERLVAIRVTARPAAGNLLHPKPYEPLFKAIDASGDSRQALMAQFLKTWYKSLTNTYWYNCHKGPEGGGFFGYWSIEAAAVAKVFAIDDEAFREMPYYPKDLVRG